MLRGIANQWQTVMPCAFLLDVGASRGFELLSTTGEYYLKQKVT
jgi:hypothetical protein